MGRRSSVPRPGFVADPFGERPAGLRRMRCRLLGADFEFEAADPALLALVEAAYAGLPRHRLPGRPAPRFRIRLRLTTEPAESATFRPEQRRADPPVAQLHGGAGLLVVALDAGNFAVVDPSARRGLVVISRDALRRWPRLVRYELLEFAVFTLAHRGQSLVSLHAACVGAHGRGVLLVGDSGAGKTTLALHAIAAGLDFLTEDATFVDPATLRATGVPNFLHVRRDSVSQAAPRSLAARVRRSPRIRRRSGVDKHEVDLRRLASSSVPAPVAIAAVVFLSAASGREKPELVPLRRGAVRARLAASQAYAASQPGWTAFVRGVAQLPVFELRRGRSPADSLPAIEALLGVRPRPR